MQAVFGEAKARVTKHETSGSVAHPSYTPISLSVHPSLSVVCYGRHGLMTTCSDYAAKWRKLLRVDDAHDLVISGFGPAVFLEDDSAHAIR